MKFIQTKQTLVFISLLLIAGLSHADEASVDRLIKHEPATIDVLVEDEISNICFNTKTFGDLLKKKTEEEDEVEELVS